MRTANGRFPRERWRFRGTGQGIGQKRDRQGADRAVVDILRAGAGQPTQRGVLQIPPVDGNAPRITKTALIDFRIERVTKRRRGIRQGRW